MTLGEWVNYHNTKAEKRCGKADSALHPAIQGTEILWTDAKHGACQFVVNGDTAFITGIVGDFKHWESCLHRYGLENGINRFIGYTCSNKPYAVARLIGMKVTRIWYEMERGLDRECASKQLLKQQ